MLRCWYCPAGARGDNNWFKGYRCIVPTITPYGTIVGTGFLNVSLRLEIE